MPRPLWADAGADPAAVADHLDQIAPVPLTDLEPVATDVPLQVLHQAAILRARRQLALRHGEKDRVLAQEVRAVDDLVRTANLLIERLREWYALHAPEAVRLAPDAEKLARLVAEHGDRATVMAALEHADELGVGAAMDPGDMAAVQGFAAALRGVHEAWRAIERRIEAMMEDVAPNLLSVVGPVLGARLIAQAGDLERLATFSTGTVQLLGAETALFRHLKEGTKPPKHGTLFQHPAIHTAPPWQRGPIARSLGQAASLAAKADAFSGRDLREDLRQGLEADLARIRRRHARPKPSAPGKGRGGPKGRPGPGKGGGPGGRSHKKGGKPGGGKPGGGKSGGGKPGGRAGGKDRQPGGTNRQGAGGPGGRDAPGGAAAPGSARGAGKRQRDPGAFRGEGGPARPPGRGR